MHIGEQWPDDYMKAARCALLDKKGLYIIPLPENCFELS
jgi:hypothetical protein